MRRICLGFVVMLGAIGLGGAVASATPVVQSKVQPVPIPGSPKTGNILGAGAALEVEYTISGTEYGGYPPPIVGVDFSLPKGFKLSQSSFPTCPKSTLEPSGPGPSACPKGSVAGPVGHVLVIVAFGSVQVPEEATLEPFYAPGGGIEFFAAGHSPESLEILSGGPYVHGGKGFGPELITEVPLVETVPGAPDASFQSIRFKLGTAIKKGTKTVYDTKLPSRCPTGGFRYKSELAFAGLGGLSPQTVTSEYRSACPR